jgi:hypothetical protein
MIAKVQLEDGRIARFEVPEGTTPEEVMAHAQSLSAPQAEAPKEEGPGGYIPFLNKTLAGIGAGVDLFAGALRNSPYPGQFSGQPPPEKVGGLAAAIPEDSFGGTQSVRRGMANIGAPTPDRGPRTTLEYMGQATAVTVPSLQYQVGLPQKRSARPMGGWVVWQGRGENNFSEGG